MQLTRQKHPWLETNFSEGSVSPKKREETVFPGKIILLSLFHCLSALWRQEEKGGNREKEERDGSRKFSFSKFFPSSPFQQSESPPLERDEGEKRKFFRLLRALPEGGGRKNN